MRIENSLRIIDKLSSFLKETIDLNTSETKKIENVEGFYKLEGTTENTGDDESYIIYDCSAMNDNFNFSELSNVKERDENFSSIIVIFRNWDHERELFFKAQKNLKREERTKLKEIYSQKISYYTDIDIEMEIPVDEDGINYLEYKYNKEYNDEEKIELKGFVYNVSMAELKEVFNVTGSNLFNKNVRYGLNKDRTGLKLKAKFKKYIQVKCLMNYENDEKMFKNLSTLFDIDKKTLNYNQPEQFWFYHNGITIFSYDSIPIDRTGDTVKINPRKISVINGAQTLTQFFTGMEELTLDMDSLVENIDDLDEDELLGLKSELKTLIKEASKDIFVKTIFIEGNEENVKEITSGLNTQIPILEEDQLADKDIVKKINTNLKSSQIKILKEGENPGTYRGIKILDFAKLYLITKMKPGTSKNFQKRKLEETIEEIDAELENPDSKVTLLDNLNQALNIDNWWKKRPRSERENHIELDSYGKNYFQSFVINEIDESEDSIDDELLLQLYNKFIKVFNTKNLTVGDFKTDTLFEKYRSKEITLLKKSISKSIEEIDKNNLIDYINKNRENMYSVSNTIMDYMGNEGIKVEYFRVIAIKDWKVKESYPFPNSTFNDLYQWDGYPKGDKYKEFSESKFLQELKKEYPVFILSWKEINTKEQREDSKQLVQDLEIIEDFSFIEYKEAAEKVYKNTVKAFKSGDENLFPKISNDLKFHIRPKAANAEDTFEFSNGELLTKRTFWANSKTIEELIVEKGYDKFFKK